MRGRLAQCAVCRAGAARLLCLLPSGTELLEVHYANALLVRRVLRREALRGRCAAVPAGIRAKG